MERLTYTPHEVAKVLGCSASKVVDLVHRGVLDRVPHMGRRVLIPRRSVEKAFPDLFRPATTVRIEAGPDFQ